MDRVTLLSGYNRSKGITDMPFQKAFSRQSFVFMLILGLVALAATAAVFHFGLQRLSLQTAALATPEAGPADLAGRVTALQHLYFIYLAAIMAGLLVFCGLAAWLGLRRTAGRLYAKAPAAVPKKKKEAGASAAEAEAQKIRQQRLFLHLLTILQRQGRLVDFLSEDLDQYGDEQIGAAVRGIHENCKKVISKNLALEAVIDGNEGEPITVEKGFDPGAIKLTGNVAGDPPFQGILRHKGWRTKKLELPVLSEAQDAAIIAPAEVEIP
jgi:hypothetical protein